MTEQNTSEEGVPEISTIHYTSIAKNARYMPLNLGGLRARKNWADAANAVLVRLEHLFDRFLPSPPSDPREADVPLPFQYSIPADQERIGRPTLHDRRSARIRAHFRRLAALSAVLLAIPIVALIREVPPLTIGLSSSKPVVRATLAPSPSAPPTSGISHVVRRGEFWGRIARRYNVSVAALCGANAKTPDSMLMPGDRLVIPSSGGFLHIVQAGDTLNALLLRYHTGLAEFRKANALVDSHDLKIGQKLFFCGKTR